MSNKSLTKKQSESKGGARVGEGGMPGGEMDRPFKEGLMEMPSGGEMASGGGPSGMPQGGMPGSHPGTGGGLMPGENPGMNSGMQENDMPGGDMTST